MISSLTILCVVYSLLAYTAAFPASLFSFTTGPSATLIPSALGTRPITLNNPSPPTTPSPAANSAPSAAPSDTPPPDHSNTTLLAPEPETPQNVTIDGPLQADVAAVINTVGENRLGYSPTCWTPRQTFAIEDPADCNQALHLIFKEGKGLTPITWTAPRSWTVGSCAILMVPDTTDAQDVFSRLDIVYTVDHIRQKCVDRLGEFRGGHMEVGPLGQFHVSVEAMHMH